MKLIEQISQFENLYHAFFECARGKRSNNGYHRFLPRYGEYLKSIEMELKNTNNFAWGGYKEFYVIDPKKRLVMAAPFRDRVVHTAINRVVEPLIDKSLSVRTYACRHGMGNRKAAQRLSQQLQVMGQDRYCIKLDVKKYFESIPHNTLLEKIRKKLPDNSINLLLESLVASHKTFARNQKGIPIGNLTSQLFANFYLSDLDQLACHSLQIDFFQDHQEVEQSYLRYMDDLVILTRSKQESIAVANQLVVYAEHHLSLSIPSAKYMLLARDPIPFLGYVHDHQGYRALARNNRRFAKKIRRMTIQKKSLSQKAQVMRSFEAWSKLF